VAELDVNPAGLVRLAGVFGTYAAGVAAVSAPVVAASASVQPSARAVQAVHADVAAAAARLGSVLSSHAEALASNAGGFVATDQAGANSMRAAGAALPGVREV
jgi:hypothetical protein